MKKGRIFSVLIAIVMITLSFTGCFSENDNSEKTTASYNIEIAVDREDNYSLIIPFPSNNGEFVSSIYNDLQILKGNCDYHIANTTKGLDNFGLQIDLNSNLKINWQDNNNLLYPLSLENRTSREDDSWYENEPIWLVYLKSNHNNSIDVNIRYEVDEKSIMNGFLIKGQINNGWNKIIGKKLLRQD